MLMVKVEKDTDYAPHLIKVKNLAVLVEQLYNNKNYDAAIEAATELCVEARHMKNRMHHQIEESKK
jgi:hypothetical protein